MVIVKGSFPIKECLLDDALELMESFSLNMRHQAGCLACEVYRRADTPATFMVWQQWRNSHLMESHFMSDAMEDFLDRLARLLDGRVDTLYFDVETAEDEMPVSMMDTMASVAEGVTLH